MYIVGFNGPPECGKDTLAELVAEQLDVAGVTIPVRFESLSMTLRKVAYQIVGELGELDGVDYAEFKRTEYALLGVTGRQLMIDVSEKFLKPTYGVDVMSKLLLERNEDFHGLLLIRDMGFQTEVDKLATEVGFDNMLVVQVSREGKTFEGDSRERTYHPEPNRNVPVPNHGSLEDLQAEAAMIVDALIHRLGWKL
jgi:hypothetical protein